MACLYGSNEDEKLLEKELGKRSSYVDWKSFLCFQQVSMAIMIAVLARRGGFHITAVGA